MSVSALLAIVALIIGVLVLLGVAIGGVDPIALAGVAIILLAIAVLV